MLSISARACFGSLTAGTVGFSPYDSVQRVGVDMINNPDVGIRGQLEMDRWPKEQLIRMPHPGHIRPRLGQTWKL